MVNDHTKEETTEEKGLQAKDEEEEHEKHVQDKNGSNDGHLNGANDDKDLMIGSTQLVQWCLDVILRSRDSSLFQTQVVAASTLVALFHIFDAFSRRTIRLELYRQ
jgi:hypothetical protein